MVANGSEAATLEKSPLDMTNVTLSAAAPRGGPVNIRMSSRYADCDETSHYHSACRLSMFVWRAKGRSGTTHRGRGATPARSARAGRHERQWTSRDQLPGLQ